MGGRASPKTAKEGQAEKGNRKENRAALVSRARRGAAADSTGPALRAAPHRSRFFCVALLLHLLPPPSLVAEFKTGWLAGGRVNGLPSLVCLGLARLSLHVSQAAAAASAAATSRSDLAAQLTRRRRQQDNETAAGEARRPRPDRQSPTQLAKPNKRATKLTRRNPTSSALSVCHSVNPHLAEQDSHISLPPTTNSSRFGILLSFLPFSLSSIYSYFISDSPRLTTLFYRIGSALQAHSRFTIYQSYPFAVRLLRAIHQQYCISLFRIASWVPFRSSNLTLSLPLPLESSPPSNPPFRNCASHFVARTSVIAPGSSATGIVPPADPACPPPQMRAMWQVPC